MGFLYFLGIALGASILGGLNGAIITSRLVYKEDIRSHGSGNAGLTNFLRTYGSRAIFLLILIDVLKTAVPVILGGTIVQYNFVFGTASERMMIGRIWGGLFAMIGHAYPWLYRFKGGKAVLAGGTLVLFLDLRVAALVLGVFLVAVILTRYVSLGSILAGIALPVSFLIFGFGFWATLISALCGAFVVYRHRENVDRLLRGQERKVSFGRRGRDSDRS